MTNIPCLRFLAVALLVYALGGCASKGSKAEVKVSETRLPPVSASAGHLAFPPPTVWYPGEDHLYWLCGERVVHRVSRAQPLWMTESTQRLVVGHSERGDLSYQPALLAQELTGEVQRLRDLVERNRQAMVAMTQASAQLTEAATKLVERNRQLMAELRELKTGIDDAEEL